MVTHHCNTDIALDQWFLYECPRAAVTKCHKVGGLEQQKCIVLQFQRPEVQNQGVSRLPLKSLLSPWWLQAAHAVLWLVDRLLQSLSSHGPLSASPPSCDRFC